MKVKVDRVYRDANGVQRCVDFTQDTGVKHNKPIRDFILTMRTSGCNAENFTIVDNAYLRGKGCNLEFISLLTVDEIIEGYPDKWVALRPFVVKKGTLEVTYGVLRKVMSFDECQEFRLKCDKAGTINEYYFFRTTAPLEMGYGFGVI